MKKKPLAVMYRTAARKYSVDEPSEADCPLERINGSRAGGLEQKRAEKANPEIRKERSIMLGKTVPEIGTGFF